MFCQQRTGLKHVSSFNLTRKTSKDLSFLRIFFGLKNIRSIPLTFLSNNSSNLKRLLSIPSLYGLILALDQQGSQLPHVSSHSILTILVSLNELRSLMNSHQLVPLWNLKKIPFKTILIFLRTTNQRDLKLDRLENPPIELRLKIISNLHNLSKIHYN